jgi:Purine nucleoside permease (NUP)
MVAGIAGINPKVATTGAVTFAKYAIQVALQYEIDARELTPNFTTGYFPLGAYLPDQYPVNIYGTEVFELNERLQDIVSSSLQCLSIGFLLGQDPSPLCSTRLMLPIRGENWSALRLRFEACFLEESQI